MISWFDFAVIWMASYASGEITRDRRFLPAVLITTAFVVVAGVLTSL